MNWIIFFLALELGMARGNDASWSTYSDVSIGATALDSVRVETSVTTYVDPGSKVYTFSPWLVRYDIEVSLERGAISAGLRHSCTHEVLQRGSRDVDQGWSESIFLRIDTEL